jgi:undecaprenyl diphosphate synthase
MSQSHSAVSATAPKYLSKEELSQVNPERVPHHVAIIPDGNRRWAKERGLASEKGHYQGADSLIDIVRAAKHIGIKIITVYGFSTENNKRSEFEVNALMYIMERYLIDQREEMVRNGIRCRSIGDIQGLPSPLVEALHETERATEACADIDLVLALNYGGRDEISRAVRGLARACVDGTLKPEEITEDVISQALETAAWPDPDLLIRTSGELRISNFLIWQVSYAELVPVDTYWPDFSPQALLKAILDYQHRHRRLGL